MPQDKSHGDTAPTGRRDLALGLGLVLLPVLCCAGPALLAAGALGALGGFMGNPAVLVLAALLAAAAVGAVLLPGRGPAAGPDCCSEPPNSGTSTRTPGANTAPHRPVRP